MGKKRSSIHVEGEREAPDPVWNRIVTWSPSIVWSAVIFYTSTLPGSSFRLPPFRFVDKLIHMCVFGLLSLLVLRGGLRAENRIKAFYFGIIYSILYGLADEIHQFFIPGRFVDPFDFLANVVGILIGALIFTRFLCGPKGESDDVNV